jgi:hypothetical protein
MRFVMHFTDLLRQEKKKVLAKWFKAISEGYPSDTCKFLEGQKDPFANPVGHALRHGTEGILEELLKEKCSEEINKHVDEIVRMFAVQDFSPTGALFFLYHLKDIAREFYQKTDLPFAELLEFETRIDQVVLLGFDNYMKCREQVWELKATTIQRRTHNLLERAKLLRDLSGSEGETAEEITGSEQKKRGSK